MFNYEGSEAASAGIIGGADGPTAIILSGALVGPVWICVALTVLAYLIGNISPSILLARAKGIDIHKEGSGNAGTTNALRVMGKKAGIITLAVDVLKGTVAVVLGGLLGGHFTAMMCVIAVFCGHVWPVFFKFKGGKGVATAFGALLGLNPLLALSALAVVAVVVLLTKRMSAGSLAGALLFPILAFFLEPEFFLPGVVLALIVIIKHRANLMRLLKGEEPKLSIFDKKGEK